MFGNDVADNFITMATFCDGGKPLVKDALAKDPVYKQVLNGREQILYRFQNSATFADPFDDPILHEKYWNISMDSIKRFIDEYLDNIPAVNLNGSRETMK